MMRENVHGKGMDKTTLAWDEGSLGNQTLGKSERRVWEIGRGGSVPLGWNVAHFQLAL